VLGEGEGFATAQAAIAGAYDGKVTDEFILPAVIGGYAGMKDGDGLLSFNFRSDRKTTAAPAAVEPPAQGRSV
jgi:2,3-bisphosphoglycerate-independent phosphoglycerate mutase